MFTAILKLWGEDIGIRTSKYKLKQLFAKNKTTNEKKNILIKELKTN